jgi:proteasome lid subunit RPN8/RPN11
VTAEVRIPRSIWEDLLQQANDTSPAECCGLLLGRAGDILEAVPAANVDREPHRRFQVDPAAHFAAVRRARDTGVEVIGAYHSHPRGAPVPSETDRAEAFDDPHFVHLLISPLEARIAAYSLVEGNFVAVPLVRIP